MIEIVSEELEKILKEKSEAMPMLTRETVLLNGEIAIDSLDLAMLIVALEDRTGRQPFRAGFKLFHTAGELADLFDGDAA